MQNLFEVWRRYLDEGGAKSLKTRGVELTPQVVKQTVAVYERALDDWNQYLENAGEQPVKPLQPVGSVTYYEKDLESAPGTLYGDIDYLVEFPFAGEPQDDTERRQLENATKRRYTNLLVEWLKTSPPPEVDVEDTIKEGSNPLMLILQVEEGVYVQVDTIITFPKYSDWMRGRYVPEHGIKGYATGNLFASLGEFFPITIGTEGVIARFKDGELVSSRMRKGVEIKTLSTDPRRFLYDIAKFFAPKATVHPLLKKNPGMIPEQMSIEQIARGIKGLAYTLESGGYTSAGEMIEQIKAAYASKLQKSVDDKVGKAEKKEDELRLSGYDERYIANYLSDIEKKKKKLLNVNDVAYESFMRGVES